jgi:hypothetical protein
MVNKENEMDKLITAFEASQMVLNYKKYNESRVKRLFIPSTLIPFVSTEIKMRAENGENTLSLNSIYRNHISNDEVKSLPRDSFESGIQLFVSHIKESFEKLGFSIRKSEKISESNIVNYYLSWETTDSKE